MRAHVLIYGLVGGVLIAGLKAIEYRWLIVGHSLEIYGGIVAAIFAAIGIWLGQRMTRRAPATTPGPASASVPTLASSTSNSAGQPVDAPFTDRPTVDRQLVDRQAAGELGITPRELEILGFIAEGLSNREIAERAGVSENTVKTHSSRLFDKLDARRRTQAVQRGKALGLIP